MKIERLRGRAHIVLRGETAEPRVGGGEGKLGDGYNGAYVAAVERALTDSAAFESFNQHTDYTCILQHAAEEDGRADHAALREEAPGLVRVNEAVGGPRRYGLLRGDRS